MNFKRIRKAFARELKQQFSPNPWLSKDSPVPIDPKQKKKLIRAGFLPSCAMVYDFDLFGMDAFLNYRDYKVLHPINGASSQLIDNKAFLPVILQSMPDLLPDFFAHFTNGKLNYKRGTVSDTISPSEILAQGIQQFGRLIIKPSMDGGGRNIEVISSQNLSEGIAKIQKGDFVVNNVLENESFIKSIYPHSLNTFRVVFFKNKAGKNQILMIAHRFGNSQSKFVDNVSSGGMACSVNLITGKFSKAYSYVSDTYKGWYSHHMETGELIEGARIPEWPERIKEIQSIVDRFDFVEYAGLDLAFTPSGLKMIEINSLPDPKLLQVGGPAFHNQEFKDFIFSKGYTPKKV